MSMALTYLPDMCGTYLVGAILIVLNLIIFQPCILFYRYFHYLIGKTFAFTKSCICFYDLNVCTLVYMNEATRLSENIGGATINHIIDVHWMLQLMASFYLNKNTTVKKCGI